METANEGIGILKQTVSEFFGDNCTSMAAALAYYTIFSLPPLLVIIITVSGLVLEPQQVEGWIKGQVGTLIGPSAAMQIQSMIERASQSVQGGFSLGLIFSIGGVLFGATGAFAQLQHALNTAWEVQPDPEQSGVKNYAVKRLLSLGMILAIAFLLLVTLIISSLISAMQGQLEQLLAMVGLGGVSGGALWAINAAVSLLIITQLFAAMFKVLPDATIAWRDVQVGAFVTALLFVLGKFLISFYIGQSNLSDTYGAAAALAIILVWVYYSAAILLLGAEFTQIWARHRGTGIAPDAHAVRVAGRPELAQQ